MLLARLTKFFATVLRFREVAAFFLAGREAGRVVMLLRAFREAGRVVMLLLAFREAGRVVMLLRAFSATDIFSAVVLFIKLAHFSLLAAYRLSYTTAHFISSFLSHMSASTCLRTFLCLSPVGAPCLPFLYQLYVAESILFFANSSIAACTKSTRRFQS